jgi:hypothetical protein
MEGEQTGERKEDGQSDKPPLISVPNADVGRDVTRIRLQYPSKRLSIGLGKAIDG